MDFVRNNKVVCAVLAVLILLNIGLVVALGFNQKDISSLKTEIELQKTELVEHEEALAEIEDVLVAVAESLQMQQDAILKQQESLIDIVEIIELISKYI